MADPPPRGPQAMSSSPKRSWFRFHLPTAVLMMFAAGGFVWLNACKRPSQGTFTGRNMIFAESCQPVAYGWPSDIMVQAHSTYTSSGVIVYDAQFPIIRYCRTGIVVDIAAFALLVGSCGAFCEYLIRRREVRKS